MKVISRILENQFPEAILLDAERILDDGHNYTYAEASKNLWVFAFTESDQKIETEILIKSSVKPKFTCDCKLFVSKDPCKHIAASLIKIRSLKTRVAKKPVVQTHAESARSKYNFKTILDQSNTEDLKNFIQSYARKHKDFSLAFKVHFASKTETSFEEDKFQRLLDEAVKPKTFKNPTIPQRAWINFKNLLEDFLMQVQDGISEEQFSSASMVIVKCLDKIAYVSHSYEKSKDKDLVSLRDRFLIEFDVLLSKIVAPDLINKIKKQVSGNVEKSYFHPAYINICSIFNGRFKFEKEQSEKIIENMYAKIKKETHLGDYKLPLILEISESDISLQEMVFERFTKMEIINGLKVIQVSKDSKLLSLYLNHKELKQFEHPDKSLMILSEMARSNQYKKFFKAAFDPENKISPFTLVELVKLAINKEVMDEYFEKFKKQIFAFSPRTQCDLFSFYGYYDLLYKTLHESMDIALINFYDQKLISQGYDKKIFETYKKFVKDYLEHHIGTPSHQQVQKIYQHLNRINAHDLRERLQAYLKKEYPMRKSLQNIFEF